ncbi:MAG: RNA-binding protein [Candidatus Tectomicrobia bacterium]|nr:RNA-binding protein [Candidatus Tectomicrobia bacterium]
MEIFVGNLSYAATEEDVRRPFGRYGTVERINIITDRETGRSRGFCFVSMPDEEEAREAIEDLNGVELLGRTLAINQARPREPRPNRRGW